MTQANRKPISILITGGHLTPAVATIEAIQEIHPDWSLIFVGRKTSLEGHAIASEEERIMQKLGVPFIPITAGRLKRDLTMQTFVALAKIPIGFVQGFRIMAKEKPSLVLSFGGYIALPIALVASFFGVPVVTHEQTMNPGLTNKILARIAKAVAISFPDTKKYFAPVTKNVIITGLPIRTSVMDKAVKSPVPSDTAHPLLFIGGGSTGSVSINAIVFHALEKLLPRFTILHQVGKVSLNEALKEQRALPKDLRDRYYPVAYLSAEEFSGALHSATLFIGRSGANTVTEVGLTGVPALWIPLPWSARNEQFQNASFLEQRGTSVILEQKNLSSDSLIRSISTLMDTITKRKETASRVAKEFPTDGARKLVGVIESNLS